MRIDKLREFREDLHDFIGTLAAGRHDDDIGLSLLGNGVLEHGLAAAERPGDKARTALGDGIERIDDTNACLHDLERPGLLLVTLDGDLDGPFLCHGHINILAVFAGEDCDDLVYVVLSGFYDGFDGIFTLEGERYHDFVGKPAFLDFSEPVGGDDLVAGLCDGDKVPCLFVIQWVSVFPSLEEDLLHGREVVLEAVVDA